MRAFISINVPCDISVNFNELMNDVKFKAVAPENIHLTLKFLGEITPKDIKEISDALNFIENRKKFKISLKRVSAFPNNKYVRVLWINVVEGSKEIYELQKKIDNALKFKFPYEKDFVPHLTMARVKYMNDRSVLKTFIKKYKDFEFLEFIAEKVSLMKSELRKEGPIYSEIRKFPLKD
ncbi:2'-5' RNA ligase [groundwater metagenome]|uniref:2'-5' RNA ligase n=1 Tax=groundwater metagenome TaxID=717931 RepID=A0A098EEI0_9ZZZZ